MAKYQLNEFEKLISSMEKLLLEKKYEKVIQILEYVKGECMNEKRVYRFFYDLGHAKLMRCGEYTKERLDDVISDLSASVEKRPTFADAHYLLACAYMKQERVTGKMGYGEEAIKHFKQAAELRPELGPNCNQSILMIKTMSGRWVPDKK